MRRCMELHWYYNTVSTKGVAHSGGWSSTSTINKKGVAHVGG